MLRQEPDEGDRDLEIVQGTKTRDRGIVLLPGELPGCVYRMATFLMLSRKLTV